MIVLKAAILAFLPSAMALPVGTMTHLRRSLHVNALTSQRRAQSVCDANGNGCPWSSWCDTDQLLCFPKRSEGEPCNRDKKCLSNDCDDESRTCMGEGATVWPTWAPTQMLEPTSEADRWSLVQGFQLCDENNTCPWAYYCEDWNECLEKEELGEYCYDDNECLSNHCEDRECVTGDSQLDQQNNEIPSCGDVSLFIDDFCYYDDGTEFHCRSYDCFSPFTRNYRLVNNGSYPAIVEAFNRDDHQGGDASLMDLLEDEAGVNNTLGPFDEVIISDQMFAITSTSCQRITTGIDEISVRYVMKEDNGRSILCEVKYPRHGGSEGSFDDEGSCRMRIRMECRHENGTEFDCDTLLDDHSCPMQVNMTYIITNNGDSKMEMGNLIRTDKSGAVVYLQSDLFTQRGSLVFEPLDEARITELVAIDESMCAKGGNTVRMLGTGIAANEFIEDGEDPGCGDISSVELQIGG